MSTQNQQTEHSKTYRDRNRDNPEYRDRQKRDSARWYIKHAGSKYGERARLQQQKRLEYGASEYGTKKCVKCITTKSVSSFRKTSKSFDGYDHRCKECRQSLSQAEYVSKMLSRAKQRAARSNVPFSLTADDIQIPTTCPVLGVLLEFGGGVSNRNNSPSLDRFIPELGYVKGNVTVISHRANLLKNSGTLEEHVKLVEWLTTKNSSNIR